MKEIESYSKVNARFESKIAMIWEGGNSVLADNRKEYILRKLEERSFVRVNELSRELELSEATVRKLLMQMEEEGLLKRNWGGAVAVSGVATEFPYQDKMSKQLTEKRSIAQAAYDLIGDGETVFLDSGTTTGQLAKLIAKGPRRNIVVCTKIGRAHV